jgi:uncharacterized Fe-S center protein
MSKVYFASRRAEYADSVMDKVNNLIDRVNIKDGIDDNDSAAIKLHFGEPGLTTYLRPVLVKPFADKIKAAGGRPFLTDANTIYHGPRSDGVSHLETAVKNGFSYTVTGAPVIIADGINGEDYIEVDVPGKFYDKVKIAGQAHRAKAMVVLSHFKGHEMFGFGGALKNIGMGLAAKEGKLSLHSNIKPKIKKGNCTKCGSCIRYCPAGSIKMTEGGAQIDSAICTGCGQCLMVCSYHAVKIKWDMDFSEAQKRTAEYAYGVHNPKKGKIWYFNFLLDITPECDCYPYSDSPLVADIGILASVDPVSIDRASYELVKAAPSLNNSKAEGLKEGEDKFKGGHPQTNPEPIFKHARDIGLGEDDYYLIEI